MPLQVSFERKLLPKKSYESAPVSFVFAEYEVLHEEHGTAGVYIPGDSASPSKIPMPTAKTRPNRGRPEKPRGR
jgi:hypothetical protein